MKQQLKTSERSQSPPRSASSTPETSGTPMSPRKRVPLLSCAPVLMAGMLEKKRRSGARAGSYQPGFYILNEMNQLERQRLSPRGVVTQANFEIEDESTPLGPLVTDDHRPRESA